MKSFVKLLFALIPLTNYSQTVSDTIPFFLNNQKNICIHAKINETDSVVLMFHTASTGMTLLKDVVGKKAKLNADKSVNVESWGGKSTADYSEGHSLTIGKMKWDSLTIYFNENSGDLTDGKFGIDFFYDKIVEIDYDHLYFIVHSKLPKKSQNYSSIPFEIKRGTMYIPISLYLKNLVYADTFMMHTGYGGSILLDPEIGKRYNMQKELPTISTSELRDAYNNVIKVETKEIPRIKIGNITQRKVSLSFAAQSSKIPMKVLGSILFRNFNMIIDYKSKKLYLKENGFRKDSTLKMKGNKN